MVKQTIRCDLCGQYFASDQLEPVSGSEQYLCADCRAEEQSCGCSDEEEHYLSSPDSDRNKRGGGRAHS